MRRDIHGIAGPDHDGLLIDVHLPFTGQDIVDLRGPKAVEQRGLGGPHDGVGKAVAEIKVRFIGVQQLPKDAVVPGDESRAILQVSDEHGPYPRPFPMTAATTSESSRIR
jgi:hypothetical protein